MKGATVLTVSSRALVDACDALGMDTAALLAATGLTRAEVNNPDGRIPVEKMTALWREAHARAGDPDLALHAAEALPFGAYAVIDFLARTSATIGAALERISRYFPLINSVVELPIERGSDYVRLDMVDRRGPGKLPRAYAEYVLAAVVLRTRGAVGVAFPLVRVELAYEAPALVCEHERIFGCPVVFGTERTGIVLAHSVADKSLERGDSGLAAVLERHAQLLISQLPPVSDSISEVRATIKGELEGGDPSLDHVARKLGTSRRSLQRRLADENLTYAQVLDEVRSTMARAYLGRPELSIAEVAYLLGFSEQSSFTRAFRRWTGTSPAEFRRTSTS
ncbi:MAG TPA: AraC family transcriptional regulator [Kofleriaceae bacterium]|nr:AraC family transcriptional regulator [Kofleriaceae bacterium]